MDAVGALVTAGGRGTRMRGLEGEKPLLPVGGMPMVDRVLEALRSSRRIGRIHASVSGNAPRTREHLSRENIGMIETSGSGYVADLNQAMSEIRAPFVLVCPSDMPLLTGEGIDAVVASFRAAGVSSLSVAAPLRIVESLGASPSFILEVEGRPVVLCGISVVDRELMLTGEELSQGYLVREDEQFALNVNTPEELSAAEKVLRRRTIGE